MEKETIIITKTREKQIIKDAKKAKDQSTLEMHNDHQYTRRVPSVQSYDQAEIIRKADSIVATEVGVHSQYFSLSDSYEPSTRYLYIDENYVATTDRYFQGSGATTGDFIDANLTYKFNSPEYRWIDGDVRIHFDRNLERRSPVEFNGVPDFIKEGKTSNYLTKEQALKASVKHSSVPKNPFLKLAEIKRNREQQPDYHWEIQNYHKYPRDSAHVCFVQEIILLDPTTGKLILKREPNQSESFIDCPNDQ